MHPSAPLRRVRRIAVAAVGTVALALSLSACSLVPLVEAIRALDEASTQRHPADDVPADDTLDPDEIANPFPPLWSDEEFGIVVTYYVNEQARLTPEPEADSRAAQIWDDFVRVATPEYVGDAVIDFAIGDTDTSDTSASVWMFEDGLWSLTVNLDQNDDRGDLIATLIHEYAHLLTLDWSQVDIDTPESECDTLALEEGCTYRHSTLDRFYEKFWKPYGSSAPADDNADEDVTWEFYQQHEEDFVDEYAATNVVEDIAESFMTYVIEPESAQEGPTLASQKLAFLAGYPEYEEIRDRLRAEFAEELGRVDQV